MTDPEVRPERIRWWQPGLGEGLLGAAVVAMGLWVLHAAGGDPGFRGPDALGYLLTGIGTAAVLWGRRAPLAALLAAGTSATVLTWLDYHVDLLPFVVAGLLFMVGRNLGRRPAVAGLVVAAVAMVLAGLSRPPDLGPRGVLQSLGIFATAWVLGRLTRARRDVLLALVAAAEQRAAAEREQAAVERDRSVLAQVEGRLQIARELHDVLAHSISVISVQATVGEHLSGHDPAAARQALHTIGDVSRASLQELRQMLTLLRDDSTQQADDPVSYEPAHGLADLEPLVDTYRSAGLAVSTVTRGTPRALSASADLCAYRIIQEALTNTLKHAGPSAAAVELDYRVDALTVGVTDDGRGGTPGASGHGLVGMRERTSLLGGELQAGPRSSGGFAVRATLPYLVAPAQVVR
jgi:signal transduction histidine kinase